MAEYSECLLEPLREGFDFTLYRDRGRGAFVGLLNSRACILLVLSLFLLPPCAWSQTQLAAVSGTITDKSGAVILRARVDIVNQGTGLERSTATDTAGIYHFSGLPPGTYTIRVDDLGFQTQVREGVALVSGSESVIDFSLTMGDLTAAGNGQRERQRHRQYDLNCQRTRGRAKPERNCLSIIRIYSVR